MELINKILIINTQGCYACKINENLVLNAVEESSESVKIDKIEIVDFFDEDYKQFIKENNVTDFPTTFFIKDNEIKYSYVGTIPKNDIKYRIKCLFYS